MLLLSKSPAGSRRRPPIRLWTSAATALALAGVALSPFQQGNAAAADVPRDGRSESTALASCWDVKQTDPTAGSGTYWLYTPTLGAPGQYYCDLTTDGGGWVLLG
ncbi:MAG: hypothetical protein QG608_766, partial [Actinomycetota bacterium]|nr:hypothetical protein [Actinomycetota bacterium]